MFNLLLHVLLKHEYIYCQKITFDTSVHSTLTEVLFELFEHDVFSFFQK